MKFDKCDMTKEAVEIYYDGATYGLKVGTVISTVGMMIGWISGVCIYTIGKNHK